ncbi:monovalent cation/H+ antiporter subunit D [Sandaracinobacter neustonicus]|uniref:Monovalent cation/H+ antiporter subunit D n=1 Tax=Sandaracinobacter neustonicus TaxID=1715348 RepID=A0A501XTF8_9SPHN|nr:monovalent cation/H+ antiporter subunit D [Sandaracinobacter neustonicus]TPE63941.1 monovalent cation/H+ antiporter subunit D [Sandaracinobacter neustonicus]
MTGWLHHLIVLPIVLPMVASAIMLLLSDRFRQGIALGTTALLVAIAAALLMQTMAAGEPWVGSYRLGNWAAPFGIVLVVDRLSAMMLMLTSVLGFTALLYALARWDRAGPRFHVLFLLLLMGLNGAFLTGDIFNLFVFFEIFLAASYGLVLHGSGQERVSAGFHYISINVATSLLFLIGVSMLYGVTGTLNMADLAVRIPNVPPEDVTLLESGASILGIAFLVKAGTWPLGLWLPRTYAAAAPPVAAMFAIMSKVGIYIILRLSMLLFGDEAGMAASFANDWLLIGGMATIAFGTVGILSANTLTGIAGHYILVSSGTLLAAIGTGSERVLAGALFYLVSSTLAISAFYLVVELVQRGSAGEEAVSEPVFEDEYVGAHAVEEDNEIGVAIPATLAIIGGGFAFCALLLSGLPPLSGFIAKFAIIDGLLAQRQTVAPQTWLLIFLILGAGFAALIATMRAGIDMIWTPEDVKTPALDIVEAVPIAILLTICLSLMLWAGPVMSFMEATVSNLDDRAVYSGAVLPEPPAESARP